jgi:hypothetical protein
MFGNCTLSRAFGTYEERFTVAVVSNDTVLVLVVITALAFDFTNGFHDTGNAMATSIATGALGPRTAVAISGVLNFVGAFLSLAVAATIASGLVATGAVTLTVVAAGLAGGIIWNLLTWLLGIPSSSSHALIGGVIGSTIAAAGGSAVLWHGLVSKVVLPAVLSPIIAAGVAACGTWLLYRITRSLTDGARKHGFRIGQIGSACVVSLAHGTNDAQRLRAGYPEGVPDVDYIPLFALLGSQLTNEEVSEIADELAVSVQPESAETIKKAIGNVTHTPVHDSDVARVRAHLAAGGWPLATPPRE